MKTATFSEEQVDKTFSENKAILEGSGIDQATFIFNRYEFPNLIAGNRGLGLLEVKKFADKMLDGFYEEHREYLGISREDFKKAPKQYKRMLRAGGIIKSGIRRNEPQTPCGKVPYNNFWCL